MARKYMITSYPIKAMIAVIQLSYQYLLKKKMVFAVYPGVGGGVDKFPYYIYCYFIFSSS